MIVQTSDRISSLAGRYARYSLRDLAEDSEQDPTVLVSDIRSMAASLLRQDQHKGLRGLFRRLRS